MRSKYSIEWVFVSKQSHRWNLCRASLMAYLLCYQKIAYHKRIVQTCLSKVFSILNDTKPAVRVHFFWKWIQWLFKHLLFFFELTVSILRSVELPSLKKMSATLARDTETYSKFRSSFHLNLIQAPILIKLSTGDSISHDSYQYNRKKSTQWHNFQRKTFIAFCFS